MSERVLKQRQDEHSPIADFMMADPAFADRDWARRAVEREHPVGPGRPCPCPHDAHERVSVDCPDGDTCAPCQGRMDRRIPESHGRDHA